MEAFAWHPDVDARTATRTCPVGVPHLEHVRGSSPSRSAVAGGHMNAKRDGFATTALVALLFASSVGAATAHVPQDQRAIARQLLSDDANEQRRGFEAAGAIPAQEMTGPVPGGADSSARAEERDCRPSGGEWHPAGDCGGPGVRQQSLAQSRRVAGSPRDLRFGGGHLWGRYSRAGARGVRRRVSLASCKSSYIPSQPL